MTKRETMENKELSNVLAPYMSQQVASPQMIFDGLQCIQENMIAEFAKQAARENSTDEAKYLPADKLGKRYGMTSKGIAPYLLRWSFAGEVEKIAPIHPATGSAGVPRYRVADVDRMMKNLPKHAQK